MSKYYVPTESGAYALRMAAAEMIREATERGDLDHRTAEWAAVRMLSVAQRHIERPATDEERGFGCGCAECAFYAKNLSKHSAPERGQA